MGWAPLAKTQESVPPRLDTAQRGEVLAMTGKRALEPGQRFGYCLAEFGGSDDDADTGLAQDFDLLGG